ncbi:hypothetical protein H0H93_001716 [Arthromyces matolae]|nr:hypothetical protein H0H93_001716 [Arthromyces matolae]
MVSFLRSLSTSRTLRRLCRTLQPHLLNPGDLIDISDRALASVNVGGRITRLIYRKSDGRRVSFPPNTRGFLYFHHVPQTPLTTGQIRFRITSENDPFNFHLGKDLTMDVNRHFPWTIPLSTISKPSFAPLKDLLLQEGLVDDASFNIFPAKSRKVSRSLHYLEQPFIVDLSHVSTPIPVVTPHAMGVVRIFKLLVDHRNQESYSPYRGRLLLRFERSTLPEHARNTILVIRVIKVLEPITLSRPDYDMHVPLPIEGRLLEKSLKGLDSRVEGKRLLTINVDSPTLRNCWQDLRLLVGAEKLEKDINA